MEYHSGASCYYQLAIYAAKNESVVETLADHLRIAEAEFVIDEIFTSTAKLQLELTLQGRHEHRWTVYPTVYRALIYDISNVSLDTAPYVIESWNY